LVGLDIDSAHVHVFREAGHHGHGGRRFNAQRLVEDTMSVLKLLSVLVRELVLEVASGGALLQSGHHFCEQLVLEFGLSGEIHDEVGGGDLDGLHTGEEQNDHFVDDLLVVVFVVIVLEQNADHVARLLEVGLFNSLRPLFEQLTKEALEGEDVAMELVVKRRCSVSEHPREEDVEGVC